MKSMLTRNKAQKGITLIALVVTIIVLLILAGVSIMMLTGQNGILKRAQEASTRTAHAEVYEMLNLETAEYLTESKLGKYSGTLIDYLKDEKHYIYEKEGIEDYIIDVEKLLGAKGKYGNGTDGIKDVYKLEEVVTEGSIGRVATTKVAAIEDKKTGKKYEVIYYGTKEEEKVSLGYLQDEETGIAKDPASDLEPEEEVEALSGDVFKYDTNGDGTITITGMKEEYSKKYYQSNEVEHLTVLKIPSEIDGHIVKSIDWKRTPNFSSVDKIIYPDSVESISGCIAHVSEVVLPSNLKTLGYNAITGSLTELMLPEGLTTIKNGAINYCKNLTEINLPNTVTTINKNAISGCENLNNINVSKGTSGIEGGFYYECPKLKEITVDSNNSNYKSIEGMLYNKTETKIISYPPNKEQTSYNIPQNVTTIGDYAFFACKKLIEISIPQNLTDIGIGAFENCSGLSNISIPQSITSIKDYTFYGCSNLTNIDMSLNVTTIGSCAFWKCSRLTSIIIPDIVTSIGSRAFSECTILKDINIPNGVTNIGGWAFSECSKIPSITIPNTVKTMGEDVFYGWKSNQTINIQFKKSEIPSTWTYSWNESGYQKLTEATINYLPEN